MPGHGFDWHEVMPVDRALGRAKDPDDHTRDIHHAIELEPGEIMALRVAGINYTFEFMARSPALDFVNNLPQLPAFQ